MKKLTILIVGLVFTGTAFAAPLSDQGSSTSDSKAAPSAQTERAKANEKSKMGTTGSGMSNSASPVHESVQKNKSPASQGSGIKQEK
jgi:hypothetical protein